MNTNYLRKPNTDRVGRIFDPATVQAVWEKGVIVAGYDKNLWRKDSCGAWIKRTAHGNTADQNGWEIDHVKPVAKDGTDDLFNLQPLQWENNRFKSDNYPGAYCKVQAA